MYRKQILVLGGVLLLSLATGFVAAQSLSDQAPRGNWDTTDSTGEIILDNESYYRVYQGERDIQAWRNIEGDDVTGEVLVRSTGGDILELERSIDTEQETGMYESRDGELTAFVIRPRVSRFNLYNRRGSELSEDSGVGSTNPLLIEAEWNFVEAEDLRIEITDPEGVEVTRAVLTDELTEAQADLLPSGFSESFLDREVQGTGSTGYSSAYWAIDPGEFSGGRHEVRVEGVEDLDFGRATDSISITVGDVDEASLRFDTTTASRGERVRYTVRGGEAGDYHAVGVPTDSIREGGDPEDIFRFVGDTVEVGSTDEYAYAVVRVSDRGTAIGSIDSTYLERGSVSFRLFRADSSVEGALDRIGEREADRRTVDVERSELSYNLASGTYVTGQSIDVSGTASPGVDRVALYVRDRGDWEILPLNGRDTVPVRSDGTWEERNVVLSEEEYGGELFRFPGTYSIAVVDAADLSDPPPRTISRSDFGRLTTSRTTTRVNEPSFVANIRSYIGEVAQGDRVYFRGVSTGSREVVVGFIGRSDVHAEVIRTTRGNLIETNIDIGGMRNGEVTAFAVSPGRDGRFGTGGATDGDGNSVSIETPEEFRDYVRSFDSDRRTREQKIDIIRADSVERAGSDDLIRTTRFRITEPSTVINDIVPSGQPQLSGIVPIERGESMLVRGTTNRNPDDTDITVEVVEGPDVGEFDLTTLRSWSGGTWSTRFTTSGVSTGTYTVEVDDGESTDRTSFTVVNDRETELDEMETLRQSLEELRTELDVLRQENNDTMERVEELRRERDRLRERLNQTETPDDGNGGGNGDGNGDGTDGDNGDDGGEGMPGFTGIAALVALAAAAVLVARKHS